MPSQTKKKRNIAQYNKTRKNPPSPSRTTPTASAPETKQVVINANYTPVNDERYISIPSYTPAIFPQYATDSYDCFYYRIRQTETNDTFIATVTTLESAGRIIYLDANNTSSYAGSGATTWTNLDSEGDYNATLNGSPTFNTTDANNKYIEFNPGAATGQFAQISQATAINPVLNQPFTIQMWVKINNVGHL